MRKVISEVKTSDVYLSDLTGADVLGLQSSGGNKFVLSKTSNGFEFVGNNNLQSCSKTQYKTLKEAVDSNGDIFIFDSTRELFKWMSE